MRRLLSVVCWFNEGHKVPRPVGGRRDCCDANRGGEGAVNANPIHFCEYRSRNRVILRNGYGE